MKNNRGDLPVKGGCTPRPKFLGALKKMHSEKLPEQLKNYVMSNLISVITAAGSILGGLLILFYLVSIQYFPSDMNVSMVGLLLAGAAITGIFLTPLLALYFVLPGVFYRHILNAKSKSSQEIEETAQINLLSNRAIIWLVDVPSLIVFVIAIVVVLFKPNGFKWIGLLAALPFFILLLYGKFFEEKKKILPQFIDMLNRVKLIKWKLAYFFVSGLMAFIPWFFILLLIANYAGVEADEDLVWFVFVEMCMIAILANHIVASIKDWWVLAIVAPVVLFLLLALTQQTTLISKVVIRTLALGNIPNVTLVLDLEGCRIASQYVRSAQEPDTKTQPRAFPMNENKSNSDKEGLQQVICRLSLVNLKWRIGSEYFVDATNATLYPVEDNSDKTIKKKQGKQIAMANSAVFDQLPPLATQSFTIPSAHVLSWSVAEHKKSVTQ
jgi:MFS family permease